MRATEIAQRLAQQVDGVVRELLPNGKRQGREWKVGSVSGEEGESLGVVLTGDKAGVWSDFQSGESGDLIGLWMAVRSLNLFEASKEAMDFLGITEQRIENQRPAYKRPTKENVAKLSDAHREWLQDVRKIAPESIAAFKLATRQTGRGPALMFPYLRGGELLAAKYRGVPEKSFWTDAECEPCLFGWQAVRDTARTVVLCEGELDALAWHTYGVDALSVPFGGGGKGKQQWVESEFDRLSLFDQIYLSMDDDQAGEEATAELLKRLGRERCRLVKLPHKDANDCLMQGITRDVILKCVSQAKTLDPSELKNVGEFEDAIWREFNRVDEGLLLPWKKTHDTLRLREGETSIWAGVNGHGKSIIISNVVADMATHGVKCCVASMEFRTPLWLMKMARQIAGRSDPTEAFVRHITQIMARNLWAFDVSGRAKAERILDVFAYARRRYGIELFVIDNLTKCGFADDDYSGQKHFIETITDFARDMRTHVAIVAHMRKSESEDKPSGKFGVKGSGGIIDMCDTSIEVWRNKPRERALEKIKQATNDVERDAAEAAAAKYMDRPDTLLLVNKQRATGIEPTIGLWFDKDSTQFLSSPEHRPRAMVEFSANERIAA